jgi:Fe-S cluster assembly protein SufB
MASIAEPKVVEQELSENQVLSAVNQEYADKYGFSDTEDYVFKAEKGLTEQVIRDMSARKGEPEWMLEYRLKAYEHFLARPMPAWGGDLSGIDFENIYYYIKPSSRQEDNWEDVPSYIKNTFDRLGIPEAEQKFLSGVAAQYESEVVYHNIKKELEDKGVIFLGMDDGLAKFPELVKEYFGTIIPYNDNKFAALNTAIWGRLPDGAGRTWRNPLDCLCRHGPAPRRWR